MQKTPEEIKKEIIWRTRLIYLAFFALGMGILIQILTIQFGPQSAELKKRAVSSIFERVVIPAERGDVLAVDGRLLATSIPTYEIRMDFAAEGLKDSVFNKHVGALADSLSRLFGDRSAASYKKKLISCRKDKSRNRYVKISPRRINYIELSRVSKFPLFKLGQNKSGFIIEQINKRIRPHGAMAQRTIGNVNMTGRGTGIEGAFDKELRGTDGNSMMQKISGSFRVPVSNDLNCEPVNGLDVLTTIDVDIQDVAEASLRRQMEEAGSDWGTAILMEVATGEIRAISNLSRYGDQLIEDYNHAVGTSLEPGSTFKLASLITLIEDAGMKLSDIIDTGDGEEMIYSAKVVDTRKGGYGKQTLKGVFEHSSNIGFAKAVNKYYRKDEQRYVDLVRKLGLGDTLNIQIPGAATPSIMNVKDRHWSKLSLTMMAYGYAVRVTPIQILTFYNAVANNGKMVSPMLVKELRQYGEPVTKYNTVVMREKICSDQTLAAARECLEAVVNDGTARVLKNPNYKVAGKTGTAQIALGRYGYYDRSRGGRHYLGTIVGYFPADNPKYTCLVAIKTFRRDGGTNPYYGGSLAGPVFRDIADRVYGSSTAWQPELATSKSATKDMPVIKAGREFDLKGGAKELQLPIKETLLASTKFRNYVTTNDSVIVADVEHVRGVMPDVNGMGLRDAVLLLEGMGLKVRFAGRGTIVTQLPMAGSVVSRSDVVQLTLGIVKPEEPKENEENKDKESPKKDKK